MKIAMSASYQVKTNELIYVYMDESGEDWVFGDVESVGRHEITVSWEASEARGVAAGRATFTRDESEVAGNLWLEKEGGE